MNRFISSAILAACILSAPVMAIAAEDRPDATVEFSGGTVAAGVGFSWAKGTLRFEGTSYPVELKGLSVASVAAGSVTASGDVYHLAKLDDFNGNYAAVSAGAALAGGGAATTMENQNGVIIKLRSTTQGAQLNLSLEGVTLKVTN